MRRKRVILSFLICLVLAALTGCIQTGKLISAENRSFSLRLDTVYKFNTPVFPERASQEYFSFNIAYDGHGQRERIRSIRITLSCESDPEAVSEISVTCASSNRKQDAVFGKASVTGREVVIEGDYAFGNGVNTVTVGMTPSDGARLTDRIGIESFKIILEDDSVLPVPVETLPALRFARVVRAAGQDGADTYRIPGLVTTGAGTLIAVYDIRYNGSKDLQEDIDIGMSRSTDGGETWEPMKVIMDMGEWGGLSQQHNGIGDPCILYDHFTNTIWVAALWMNGSAPDRMIRWDSQPGMEPDETGQLMMVKSTDDGITWTEPVSITQQIKDPSWQLLLQGPGRGITLSDGTLVFPAQFKKELGVRALDGGLYTPHSTIVYSRDGGITWHIGTAAKANTTEAQVVELTDGSLMLNMRDDRNRTDTSESNGRAVAVTKDMGETWTGHPSSNSALPEPNCMASLISTDLTIKGVKKKILLFSNPNDKSGRIKMTVKVSLDEGLTWPERYWIELYAPECDGYSCMTMVDENTVGILYEGTKELYFQKITLSELTGGN